MAENKVFNEPVATQLERLRAIRRTKHRITYDCFNAIVGADDEVKCRKNHAFLIKKTGTVSLLTVLKGGSNTICEKCVDFSGDN